MKKKIEGKVKAAHLWRYITIAVALLLIAVFVLAKPINSIAKSKIAGTCAGVVAFAEVVCLVVYFGFRRNILTSLKLLQDKNITVDEIAQDLDDAKTIGKVRKIRCGEKFFVVPSPFCVFAYKDILWIYCKKTTTTNTSTGATTTNKTVIFCTAQGKKFATHISWKAAKSFLEENGDKFSPDLIVGYKMKYNKQYKELVKNYK